MSANIKSGMGGSRNGDGRRTGTEELKKDSKKARRAQGKKAANDKE